MRIFARLIRVFSVNVYASGTVSMIMKFLLYSPSMSLRLLLEGEVQLLWETHYNLQQGLMKSHLLDLIAT